MHREVSFIPEQRHLEFFREQSFGQALAFLRHGRGLELVTGGFDDLQLELQFGESGAALVQDHVGLGKRQSAAASGDGYGLGGGHGASER